MKTPAWFVTGDKIKGEIFPRTYEALHKLELADALDESLIPEAALFHISDCLEMSMVANAGGKHSVAIGLLRSCLEALTLVDLGLQENSYRLEKLQQWKDGKRTAGQIRKELERDVWPRYGQGLWEEPWTEFFGNLAQALHPYAHYSPDLMGWQFAMVQMDNKGKGLVALAPSAYDPLKATRITFLHILVLWTIGRLAVPRLETTASAAFIDNVEQLRKELGASDLLFREKDWGIELMPHVWFKQGVNWRDKA